MTYVYLQCEITTSFPESVLIVTTLLNSSGIIFLVIKPWMVSKTLLGSSSCIVCPQPERAATENLLISRALVSSSSILSAFATRSNFLTFVSRKEAVRPLNQPYQCDLEASKSVLQVYFSFPVVSSFTGTTCAGIDTLALFLS